MDLRTRHTIDVRCDADAAFALFTGGLARWWPVEYTWSQQVLEAIGMEPGIDGLCYERGPHGFRCDWGRIVAWEPSRALSFLWQIGPQREPVPDPARASTVDVTFDTRSGVTHVTLTHRAFDRHGTGGAAYRDAMASPAGWPLILARYAAVADARG